MSPRLSVLFLLSLLPGRFLTAQGSSPPRTDVPVQSVMLFSSGVGYFEHAGTVRGNSATELRFKTAQINDILKSLVLQDLNGGKVTTITYPSQDPLDKTLKSFQVDITANPGLSTLLNQLRGARVTVQIQGEKLTGTILGVEARQVAVSTGGSVPQPILNLLTGLSIRPVDLQAATSVTFEDPQLQEELTRALTALTQARDQDKKPVTINFAGSGERQVRIGYVVETPIWKTSYRLLLNDGGGNLQGWAIVENQTESDWKNVALTLVSGRPISFMMDLYQPLYLKRPTVVPQLFAGLRPQVYQGGTQLDIATNGFEDVSLATGAPSAQFGNALGEVVGLSARSSSGMIDRSKAASSQVLDKDFIRSVQSSATTAKLGELFQYQVKDVTLARHESAMLPIVTDAVSAERLSIYNAAVQARYPLTGLRLKNTTGKHLLQGPITVLDQGGYAGDAQIDNVPPGQERLLSYGIDLDLLVDNTKRTQATDIVTGKIAKGVLLVQRKRIATMEYQTENKGSRDKLLLIEHPIHQGWQLVDSPKPVETTETLYRFQGQAVAGKLTVLTVKEESINEESWLLVSSDLTALMGYAKTGELPKNVRDAITKAVELKQAVSETARMGQEQSGRIGEIAAEQDRIRENMKTVSSGTAYYDRLLAKLNEQESQIEKLQALRNTLHAKELLQQEALETYLAALTVG